MTLRALYWLLTVLNLSLVGVGATTPPPSSCGGSVSKLAQSMNILAAGLPGHPVIDGHLVAYQNRDLEGFASFFSAEIKSFKNGQDNLSGISQLRDIYAKLFSASPNLRVRISERRIEGEYIFDTEHVVGLRGSENEITAKVKYRVVDGKIIEMHLSI